MVLPAAAPLGAAGETLCGTSVETDRQARQLARFVEARPAVRSLTAQPVRSINDFLIVPVDAETAPFDDPADLQGMSFLFTPAVGGFRVGRQPLSYDSDPGPLFVEFGRGESTKPLELQFTFPFGDRGYDEVTLSVVRGIHFTERPRLPAHNFVSLEMLAADEPLIAPLLDHVNSPSGRPVIFVKQTADAATITWRSASPGVTSFDIQAVLFRDGSIRFSYAKVENISWGGVVLTTGRRVSAESTVLSSMEDPAGDVQPLLGDSR
ncbi:MAG TPA: hypothetical protein VFT12_07475, partial [Thermoanaerobaculia bacterium]|nr:hypothetical protein [Thermoanaerobaculia bacterium]